METKEQHSREGVKQPQQRVKRRGAPPDFENGAHPKELRQKQEWLKNV